MDIIPYGFNVVVLYLLMFYLPVYMMSWLICRILEEVSDGVVNTEKLESFYQKVGLSDHREECSDLHTFFGWVSGLFLLINIIVSCFEGSNFFTLVNSFAGWLIIPSTVIIVLMISVVLIFFGGKAYFDHKKEEGKETKKNQ